MVFIVISLGFFHSLILLPCLLQFLLDIKKSLKAMEEEPPILLYAGKLEPPTLLCAGKLEPPTLLCAGKLEPPTLLCAGKLGYENEGFTQHM